MHTFAPLLLAGAVLAGSLQAQLAGSYTVNPTWPATTTNFTSLASAVAALNAGGVAAPVVIDVYDDAGPYTESVPFTTANVTYAPSTAGLVLGQWTGVSPTIRVTFRAAPGESPVIDATAQGMGVFWNGADYVTLDGFEIKNAPFDGISLYAEATHGQAFDPIITNCRIHDCGGSGVCVYGNVPQPTNTLIKNCFFWHLETTNAGGFNTTARFGYVTTRRSTGTRVVHNTFFVDTGAGSSFCAIGAYPGSSTEIVYAEVSNNVFVKTGAAGKPFFRYQAATGATMFGPTIQDANCYWDTTVSPFALYGVSAGTTATNLAGWQSALSLDAGSLASDPLLVNPTAGDLHLGAGSPCVKTSTVSAGVTDDIDGQTRIVPNDIGADEFSKAKIVAVGTGCPGTGGLVPVLYSQQVPFLGNQGFSVLTRLVPPAAPVGLFLSAGTSPVPINLGLACNAWLQPATLIALGGPVVAGPAGTVGIRLPVPNNPALAGAPLGIQQVVIDAGSAIGATVTNALGVTLY